jgi:cytochrome P450
MWAIGRYAPARRALENWRTFTSTQGVSVGKEFIPFFEGSTLYLDPPDHERLRRVLSERLTTKALSGLVKDVEARADELVTELALRGSFDAVKDLAEVFPVTLVADLIGLPQEGRERLLARASAAFNFFGPANQRRRTPCRCSRRSPNTSAGTRHVSS